MGFENNLLKELMQIKYPVKIKSGNDVSATLQSVLGGYLDLLQRYAGLLDAGMISSVKTICANILKIHKSFLHGNVPFAYHAVDSLIDGKLKARRINIEKISDITAEDDIDELFLFRSRIAEPNVSLSKRDMSHIPFDQREKVGSQRFSTIGIPCLYLGGSSYICWLEAGRPADNTFNVSCFKPDNDLVILNLTAAPSDFLPILSGKTALSEAEFKHRLEKLLLTWPLTLACGLKVIDAKERTRKFKEEYIIPQLILQSLAKHKIDGVAYLSTNVSSPSLGTLETGALYKNIFINYAYPIYNNTNNIIHKFSATEPINLCDSDSIAADIDLGSDLSKEFIKRAESLIPITNSDKGFKYNKSDFFKLDYLLSKEPVGLIT
jgi:hypothetical protein